MYTVRAPEHPTSGHDLRTQRLEGLGSLAGGIAHNLGNVLAPILLAVDQLEAEVDSSAGRQLLDQIRTSTQMGTEMCQQILTFAKGGGGRREFVDVDGLVDAVLRIVRESFPTSVRLSVQPADEALRLVADATQLQQVLLNLLINARDAMPDGGRLSVSTDLVDRDVPTVRIRVADTGCGIEPHHLDQLWDPFFTTKDPGEGTGLGLPTSLAIVESHGGSIEVDSGVGVGTTFDVLLPLASSHPRGVTNGERPGDPVEVTAAVDRTAADPATSTVLVVEDDLALARLIRRVVEPAGYRMLHAPDGDTALGLAAAHELCVALVDLDVPGTSGEALVDGLREVDPGVPIVVASGSVISGGDTDLDGVALLSKPFTNEALVAALAAAQVGTREAEGREPR